MRQVWDFIQHNNAVPIGLFVLFGGTGAVFAASPEAQQAIYSSTEQVQSVDNTYIVSANLATRDFNLRIVRIEEDEDNYYVAYTYNTISIVDYVWREVQVNKDLTFSKKEMLGRDLGLFLAKQLGEVMTQEVAYLAEVQTQERAKGATLKRVATEYSGLVGRMLDTDEKTFPGYVPVVEELQVESGVAAAALARPSATSTAPAPISEEDIARMVSAALAQALEEQQGQVPSIELEAPPTSAPELDPDPAPTSTPPTPDPVSTSTPPTTPPATTTPPTTPAPTSTSPTPEPEPESTPEPEPETPPADEPQP